MPRKRRTKPKPEPPECSPETFQGLRIHSDGRQPAIRTQPVKSNPTPKEIKAQKRATDRKALHDLYRLNLTMVENAIKKKVVLNFRWSDFIQERQKGNVKVENGGPFRELAQTKVKLEASQGARIVVDLDGVVVFCYFPSFMGKYTRENIMERLGDLVEVRQPPHDAKTKDRRARAPAPIVGDPIGTKGDADSAPDPEVARDDSTWAVDESGLESGRVWASDMARKEADDRWSDDGGEVTYDGDSEAATQAVPGTSSAEGKPLPRVLSRDELPPSAWYLSPGWYATGMENLYFIAMSLALRQCLQDESRRQMIAFLEAKRQYDRQVEHLMGIIHHSLLQTLQSLRTQMAKVRGPTGIAVQNGWTSCFPCFAVAFNRQTKLHRDTRGLKNGGMDVISVLGEFREGYLRFQDLNLEVEWQPGSLGAFDGYNLSHEVLEWSGTHRATLISFCRGTTWKGLKVDSSVATPTLQGMEESLKEARRTQQQAIETAKREAEARVAAHWENVRVERAAKRMRTGSALGGAGA